MEQTNEKPYTQCLMCGLVMYDPQQNYKGNISHGVCNGKVCRLEMAMKGAEIYNTEVELPKENEELFDDLTKILLEGE